MASAKVLNAARKTSAALGPHGSFPVVDAKSARAAYNLAGHAANPAAMRKKVIARAQKLKVSWALPKTAKEAMKK
jgi:hypothetical protein